MEYCEGNQKQVGRIRHHSDTNQEQDIPQKCRKDKTIPYIFHVSELWGRVAFSYGKKLKPT